MDMNIVFPVLALTVFISFFAWAKLSGRWPEASPSSTETLTDLAARRQWQVKNGQSARGYRQTIISSDDADWRLVLTYIPRPRSLGPRAYELDAEWLDDDVRFAEGDVLIGPPQPQAALDLADTISAFSQTLLGQVLSSHHRLPPGMRQRVVPDDVPLSVLSNTDAFTQLPLASLAAFIARWHAGRPASTDQVVVGLSPEGMAVRFWGSRDDAEGIEVLVDLGIEIKAVMTGAVDQSA